MRYPLVKVVPGREKSVLNRHPWIFSRGLCPVSSKIADGDLVTVASHDGQPLAIGYYNSKSEIAVRILSWRTDETIDAAFFKRRLTQAAALRSAIHDPSATTALRLVYSENDFLPGLILDRFKDCLIMQIGTLGLERRRDELIEAVIDVFGAQAGNLVERSDGSARKHEGLGDRIELLRGAWPQGDQVIVRENGLPFICPVGQGQKTGFYCDQRVNRAIVADLVRPGMRMLNAFSYTGGFGIYAAARGAAEVVNVDSSDPALGWAEKNISMLRKERPGIDCSWLSHKDDAFLLFRRWEQEHSHDRAFDIVVVDPPKFVQNKHRLETALRGYKDINRLAFKFARDGGWFATFSCSGHVSPDLFQKVIFSAAREAGRDVQITQFLFQAPDHPVNIDFPEGLYLKGLLCHVSA